MRPSDAFTARMLLELSEEFLIMAQEALRSAETHGAMDNYLSNLARARALEEAARRCQQRYHRLIEE